MAKTKRKKNYKLRRRVMRTFAALTMIMAIVVAAIPVENYGTMRAADGDDWNYVVNPDSTSVTITGFNKNDYGAGPFTVQTLTDDVLADSVTVMASDTTSASRAIISKYEGVEQELDIAISQKMYYNYAYFPVETIESEESGWVSFIQAGLNGNRESFTVSAKPNSTGITVAKPRDPDNPDDPADAVTIPSKYIPELKANLLVSGKVSEYITNRDCSFTYDYIKSTFNEFQRFENETITPYNDEVQRLIDMSENVTTENWNTFKASVEALQQSDVLDSSCKKEIDEDVTVALFRDFWLKSFCDRVTYTVREGTDVNIPLKGFDLTRRTMRTNGNDNDVYVYVAHFSGDREPDSTVKLYIDDNGYLADGYVYIDGVAENAFNREKQGTTSSIRTITLPGTIKAIGDGAFENSGLTRIVFDPTMCTQIGNRAFYGCQIAEFNFTEGENGVSLISEIGDNAFYGTNLREITLPSSLTKIGKGSFAETSLTTVEFQELSHSLTIGEHAFYNCVGLTGIGSLRGQTSTVQIEMKTGAFSVEKGKGGDVMQEFAFPDNMKWDDNSDCILAGRSNLQHVTFPAGMNATIPQNTFAGCYNLDHVTLGEISYNKDAGQGIRLGSGSGDNKQLFKDVRTISFYVEGPAIKVGGSDLDKSTGRIQTLNCKAAVDSINEFYVPYKFLDSTGMTRIEQKQGEGEVIAEIEVISEEERTAQLTKYSYANNAVEKPSEITVPRNVAGYTITSLGEGCFSEVLDDITKLTIEDGTLSEIGQGALKGASKLEEVIIGNSVASIGADAFADCGSLRDVYFNQPLVSGDDWSQVMTIAPSAFRTNSERLTFHGAIKSDYGPFVYAMDASTASFTNRRAQRNICYQVDAPSNIKVIRDNNTGLATLVDYPHLEDSEFLTEFESALQGGTLTEEQTQTLGAVFNITVPEGIQSVDTKTYFSNSKNEDNKCYVEGKFLNAYTEDGLFSGNFTETGIGGLITTPAAQPAQMPSFLKQYAYTEEQIKGNDHLTSIVLGSTVSDMPEQYAFDSCENLTRVVLGGAISDLGQLPFRGCKSLEDVQGNGYYQCENGILYGKSNPDSEEGGFDKIVECLETRGGGTSRTVKVSNDPNLENITSIDEAAFSNCLLLNDVDLTGTKITQIPKDCFRGSSRIQEIILPETVSSVQDGAFATGKRRVDGAIDIYVYDSNCNIPQLAFGDESYYIVHGYEFTDNTNTKHTYIYNLCQSYPNVEFEAIEPGWTVKFRDTRDGSIIKTVTGVSTGAEVVPPDMDEYMAEHPYEGHEFDRWLWTDAQGEPHYGRETYNDIREDRDIYAQYKIESGDYVFTGEDVTVNIVGGTLNGMGTVNENGTSITIPSGNDIFITADTPADKTFVYWTVSDELDRWINNAYAAQTTFKVPNPPESGTITITATFVDAPSSGDDPSDPNAEYTVTVINGTGGGTYTAGTAVTIMATPPSADHKFVNWTTTATGVNFASATSATTAFMMPATNVIIVANFTTEDEPTKPDDPTGPTNPTTYTVTVNNGTGSGQFAQGATVTITANTPNQGASFVSWTTTTTGVNFANANASTTTFTMPASNVTVTANFSDGTGGQQPGSSVGRKYKATVNYGSGTGEYEAGATVSISAFAPESSSRVFSKWTTNNSGLGFANANAATTTFVMPAADVTVTANYRTRTSDDDDDSTTPSRRPGTNTNTTTVENRPSSSTTTPSTTGTVNNPASGTTSTTNNNNSNGNRIYITKNGISNTDLASLAVNGSTDNFIVRITESPDATTAVEQALINTYGSLNGLSYLPMDISLYDATGQNKITDTHGLNVTVTMPIPDVLIQYGGNARVAAADNGTLQQITPRFTTIDGIACISFVPPHFSPYVIYVDTNNLIAGQMLDATPATGDPIHPKWFAAIGMACVSILLFVMSDGRKRKSYKAA